MNAVKWSLGRELHLVHGQQHATVVASSKLSRFIEQTCQVAVKES